MAKVRGGKSKPGERKGSSGSERFKKVPVAERRSFENWERVPGKAKQYKNTSTGEVLSNRQYRQRFLYGGTKSLEKIATTRGAPRKNYGRLLRARQDYLRDNGITANLTEIRQSDAMKKIVADMKKHRKGILTPAERRRLSPEARALYKKMYGPDSDLARALIDLGYRDEDARHFVGDS